MSNDIKNAVKGYAREMRGDVLARADGRKTALWHDQMSRSNFEKLEFTFSKIGFRHLHRTSR